MKVLFNRPALAGIIVGILVAIVLWAGWGLGIWERIETSTLDLRYLLRPSSSRPSSVVIIDIDQKSLTNLGKWPWPRSFHANLVKQLQSAGASVVGFDVIFSEKDKRFPEEDEQFVDVVGQYGLVVLPAYSKGEVENLPFVELREKAAGIGSAAFIPDQDGVLRRLKLGQRIKKNNYWAFGIELLSVYLSLSESDIYWKDKNEFVVNNIQIPLDEEGKMLISFRTGNPYPHFSYVDILEGNFSRGALKGKIVLVGSVAEGASDFFHTPIHARMPGVQMHAYVIDSILNRDFLTKVPTFYLVLILFLLSITTGMLFFSLKWKKSVLMVVIFLGGWFALNLFFFTQLNLILDYLPFTFAIALNFVGGIIYQNKYAQEKAQVLDLNLSSLYQMGRTTGLTTDVSQLVQLVCLTTTESLDAFICVVMLKEKDEHLSVRGVHGISLENFSGLQYKIGEGVAGEIAASGKGIIINDSRKYEEIKQFDKEGKISSSLYVPLIVAGKITGVLHVHKKIKKGFTAENLKFLFAIGTQMAITIENARLYLEVAEKERMERELEIARQLQTSLLPEVAPEVKGYQIAAKSLPAREVGGDFYDFIEINQNEIGLVIGDVAGKGLPAALFMALSRSFVRAQAIGNRATFTTLERANKLITQDARGKMFVTLFYAILDVPAKILRVSNAGHNPPLLFHFATKQCEALEIEGIALGVFEQAQFQNKEIILKSGDVVLFYTDGVVEAIDNNEQEFGMEKLTEIFKENFHLEARQLIELIENKVQEFAGSQPQFDDLTLLVVKVT